MLSKLDVRSRVSEVDAAATRIYGAYKTTNLNSNPHVASIFGQLESLNGQLNLAINRKLVNSELDHADAVRDNAMRAFYFLAKGLTFHPDADIQHASNKLFDVLDRYSLSIVTENFATESSLLNSLLGELLADDMQEAIALIPGAAHTYTQLKTAQENFENMRIDYEKNVAKFDNNSSATTIKKQVLNFVNNKLLTYIDAMTFVDPDNFNEFADTVEQIIQDNNVTIKRRFSASEEE